MRLLMRDVMDGASTPAAIFSILGPRPSSPVAFVEFSQRMNSIWGMLKLTHLHLVISSHLAETI